MTYAYGDSTDAAGELNRIGSILDYDGNTLATYSYLGLGTIVTENYVKAQMKLDYTGTTEGSYPGLDQFDRVVDQYWASYGSGPETPVDQYLYSFDRLGERPFQAERGGRVAGQGPGRGVHVQP